MTRTRHATDWREAEELRESYVADGYTVRTETDAEVLLQRHDWGSLLAHLVVFVLTVWWTLGLGNLAYAAYRRMVSQEAVRVVIDG